MKEGKMVVKIQPHEKWSRRFRSIMRTFRETGATVTSTEVDDDTLTILYQY